MRADCERSCAEAGADEPNESIQGRREAMVRLAKYTAPVMLAMLLSDQALAITAPPA